MVWSCVSEKYGSSGEPGNPVARRRPPPSVSAPPMSDASTTLPLRMRYMYRPTNRAIGIVQAMVNVPHELPGTTCLQPCGQDECRSVGVCRFEAARSPAGTATHGTTPDAFDSASGRSANRNGASSRGGQR